jgi:sigma-B regulation protein RsbU (phosphoserine phosphatase)
VDGVTYNLADSDMSLMEIGTPEEPIEAFAKYTGNDRIPPTIYQFGNDWLCTTCEPILEEWEGIEDVALAQVCVDIDMNDVIKERHWFLVRSAAFIPVFTLAMMAIALLLIRKLTTKPLKQLAAGAATFKMRDEGFSKEDVIELPIRSNDEIGDLYHDIKLMQDRIVNNADKLTHAIAERERVNTELDMAAHIQSSALPEQFPAFPDRPEFDLCASMNPAKVVGGDFYDYFLVDDDHLALVIADVSDKGVPSALFMMSARSILHYRAGMGGTPAEIMTSVNRQLCRDNPLKMFVTVWFSILELSTGRLACSNAGHEFPIIRHPGDAFTPFTDQHEIVMGIMKEISYSEYEICLEPGSKVFVYTDGLAEAQNAQEEQFGLDRIVEALNVAPDISPRELLDNMRRAVDTFVGGAPQFDDLTMLCIEYKGPGKAEAAATWQ